MKEYLIARRAFCVFMCCLAILAIGLLFSDSPKTYTKIGDYYLEENETQTALIINSKSDR